MSQLTLIGTALILSIFLCQCAKEGPAEDAGRLLPVNSSNYTVATGESTEALCDSLYLYAQALYFWNNRLPPIEEFSPRRFASGDGSNIDKLGRLLEAIKARSLNMYDRFSYIEEISENASVASIGGDTGLFIIFDKLKNCRIAYVEPNSPAARSGLRRGYKIYSVNGVNPIMYGTKPDELNYKLQNEENTILVTDERLNQRYVTLTPAVYEIKTTSEVQWFQENKTGYLFFSTFQYFSEALCDSLKHNLEEFRNKGIKSLIIDLRYNPGGNTSMATLFAHFIVPAARNPIKYNTSFFNDPVQKIIMNGSGYPTIRQNVANHELLKILAKQKHGVYSKDDLIHEIHETNADQTSNILKAMHNTNDLNLKTVVFIISKETASSAEVLINSVKAYESENFKVKVVGQTSYGKAVGSIPFYLGKKCEYEVNLMSFINKNSQGKSISEDGIDPDVNAEDDLSKDFNQKEECIKKALILAQ